MKLDVEENCSEEIKKFTLEYNEHVDRVESEIILPITKEEISEIIRSNEMEKHLLRNTSTEDYDACLDEFIFELKQSIWRGIYCADRNWPKIENTKEGITGYIYNEHRTRCEQFEYLFWEEYVYQYYPTVDYNNTWAMYEDRIKYYTEFKNWLDSNPRFHGITGQQAQWEEYYKDIPEQFQKGYRGWGAVMAAYMNSKEKSRNYNYMDFYM